MSGDDATTTAWLTQFGDWSTCPNCGRNDALRHYHHGRTDAPMAQCHHGSCGFVAGYGRGRWNERGASRHGTDADHWLTALIRTVARTTDRTDLDAYRVALALKPLAAVYGPDDLHPSINTLSELTARRPRDVRTGLRRLSQLGFITARRPTKRVDVPIHYRLTLPGARDLAPEEDLRSSTTVDRPYLGGQVARTLDPRLLRPDGIGERATRGLLALAVCGPSTAQEVADALGFTSRRLAGWRLIAAMEIGFAVTGAPNGTTTFMLAPTDQLCAVTGAAFARVAPVIERNDLDVAKRRDADVRWRRERRLRDVALGFAPFHPDDDERVRDIAATTREELATLSLTRPGGHPLRRLLGPDLPAEHQRSMYAHGELYDVVTKGRRYVISAHRPLVAMLDHDHATALYNLARRRLDRDHPIVVDLWRRRERLVPSRSIADLARETGQRA